MVDVVCECFLLGSSRGAVVYFAGVDDGPTWTASVADGSPQREVTRSAPVAILGPPHSTSWRWDAGRVVLTFVAFPVDPPTGPARVVPVYRARATEHDGDVELLSVLGHAVRHVAFLVATDPGFRCPPGVREVLADGAHVPDVFRDLTER